MFSRQHYRAIAEIIKLNRSYVDLVKAFADLFAEDNMRFDRDKFYEACELKL